MDEQNPAEQNQTYGNEHLDAALKAIAEVTPWLDAYGDKDIVVVRTINIVGKGRDVLRQVWRSLPTGEHRFPGVRVLCGDVQFVTKCGCGGEPVLSHEPGGDELESCPICGGCGWMPAVVDVQGEE